MRSVNAVGAILIICMVVKIEIVLGVYLLHYYLFPNLGIVFEFPLLRMQPLVGKSRTV